MLSRGFASAESKAAFARAQQLGAGVDNATERFDTYYGLLTGSRLRGELSLARQTAETFLREAKTEGRITETGVANRTLGMTCLYQGDLSGAHANLSEALRIYDPDRDREAKFRFGTDPGAAAAVYLALACWLLGEFGKARELIEEAVKRARESGHVPTLAIVHHINGIVEILRGDAGAVFRTSEALVKLSREHQMGLYLDVGSLSSGWARARLGDREAGVRELRQALTDHTEKANKLWVPFYEGLLAECEGEGDGREGALTRINEALALGGETGEHWTDAFLYGIRGEILLNLDRANTAPAEAAFQTALAVARKQQAKSWELRAAMSMARLLRDQGKRGAARDLLAPVYGWFTEGFDTLDLKEAKALLDELHA